MFFVVAASMVGRGASVSRKTQRQYASATSSSGLRAAHAHAVGVAVCPLRAQICSAQPSSYGVSDGKIVCPAAPLVSGSWGLGVDTFRQAFLGPLVWKKLKDLRDNGVTGDPIKVALTGKKLGDAGAYFLVACDKVQLQVVGGATLADVTSQSVPAPFDSSFDPATLAGNWVYSGFLGEEGGAAGWRW